MRTDLTGQILVRMAGLNNVEFDLLDLNNESVVSPVHSALSFGDIITSLIEKGRQINLSILTNQLPQSQWSDFIRKTTFPFLVFREDHSARPDPVLIYKDSYDRFTYYSFRDERDLRPEEIAQIPNSLTAYDSLTEPDAEPEILFITAFPQGYLSHNDNNETSKKPLSPVTRLYRLLRLEKRDIFYIYIYAFVVGLVSLSLPLGIQATIGLIAGGLVSSSIILLIGAVILGIIVSGGLQVTQVSLVENLQQRVFARAAFELTSRITQIRLEVLQKYYPPELMNRFFDVVTIQKGLPKLLVEINAAVLQILFGLILLSLYHPVFLIFSFLLVGLISLVFYLTGPKGLSTSINESDYKYKIAFWLEELARTIPAFKQAGNTVLPLKKMDELVNKYLFYRKAHFRVLITQFSYVVVFKTIVTGGLLIIGTILVIDGQITLGQFVASEVIIVLVVSSVEKLILSLDVFYDLLTGVVKVAKITDLELERNTGIKIPLHENPRGLHIQCRDLNYRYKNNPKYTLKNVNFDILAGESVCLVGPNDSGKHTLVKTITGTLSDYEGSILLNQFSLRDLHLPTVRDVVNKHLTFDEIFEGTILDNITMGRMHINYQDVRWALENVGLNEFIAKLPQGLYTPVQATGPELSSGVVAKLLLARSVASRPKLLIVNDFSEHLTKSEKLRILSFLQDKSNGWTLLILSVNDDSTILSTCDKILLMYEGEIVSNGAYAALIQDPYFQKIILRKD